MDRRIRPWHVQFKIHDWSYGLLMNAASEMKLGRGQGGSISTRRCKFARVSWSAHLLRRRRMWPALSLTCHTPRERNNTCKPDRIPLMHSRHILIAYPLLLHADRWQNVPVEAQGWFFMIHKWPSGHQSMDTSLMLIDAVGIMVFVTHDSTYLQLYSSAHTCKRNKQKVCFKTYCIILCAYSMCNSMATLRQKKSRFFLY